MRPPDQGAGEAGESSPYRPIKLGPPGPGDWHRGEQEPAAQRRSRWPDRILGVLLGILLGLGVVTTFVFLGSEETIDAPRISGVDSGGSSPGGGAAAPRIPVVRVVNGAPPPSGPATLDFKRGGRVRFTVDSDAAVGIEIPGYGLNESLDAGRSTVSFKGSRAGQYPVIVSASNIGIANLRISR
ncbi:MAG: hypothetical protein AABM29_07145 [Actinomycetota bacterium]